MIELERVSVMFGKGTALQTVALNDISVKFLKGDFVTVIGSNGAGKSTLLNLLTGVVKPSKGRVLFEDKVVNTMPPEVRAFDMAYVYQDPRLGVCESLTLEENLALALRRGEKRTLKLALKAEVREQFKEALAPLKLGLENRLKDQAALLSGGQRQALSLVMATLRPSKLLLLDEHTAALDPKSARIILDLTQKLVDERKLTTLMITHHMSDALKVGNRTLLMHEGKIIRDLTGEARSRLSPSELIEYFG